MFLNLLLLLSSAVWRCGFFVFTVIAPCLLGSDGGRAWLSVFIKRGLASDSLEGGRPLVFFCRCFRAYSRPDHDVIFIDVPGHVITCVTPRRVLSLMLWSEASCVQNRAFDGVEEESVVV